jgi:hypothetical protein
MVGTMGQQILSQQAELEERIRALEQAEIEDGDGIGEGTRSRLMELEQAMKGWESQNDEIMRELGGKVRNVRKS